MLSERYIKDKAINNSNRERAAKDRSLEAAYDSTTEH
jgi:hypothetical protein